jgi:hypothetical protein
VHNAELIELCGSPLSASTTPPQFCPWRHFRERKSFERDKGKVLISARIQSKKNEIYINRRVCYRKQVTEVVEEEKGQTGKMRQP